MKVKFQKQARINNMQGSLAFCLGIVIKIAEELQATEFEITSVDRKKVEKFSFHEEGKAADFKVKWEYCDANEELLKRAKESLDHQCDIIYHDDSDGDGFHFHLEVDDHQTPHR